MIYFHLYVYVLIQYYTTPISEYFSIFFAIEILKKYFIRSEGYTFRRYTFGIFIRSDVIRSVYLYVQIYTFRRYTFRRYTFGIYTFRRYTFGRYT